MEDDLFPIIVFSTSGRISTMFQNMVMLEMSKLPKIPGSRESRNQENYTLMNSSGRAVNMRTVPCNPRISLAPLFLLSFFLFLLLSCPGPRPAPSLP